MQVTHPLAERETEPPDAVTVAPGESYDIVDGAVDVPDDVAEAVAERWAEHYGVNAAPLLAGDVDLEDADGTLPFNPGDHTNDEVAERVADIDDPATLEALTRLEEQQQDRAGATDAIAERLDELEE